MATCRWAPPSTICSRPHFPTPAPAPLPSAQFEQHLRQFVERSGSGGGRFDAAPGIADGIAKATHLEQTDALATVEQGQKAGLAVDLAVDFRECPDTQRHLQIEEQVRPVTAVSGQQVERGLAALVEVNLQLAAQIVLRFTGDLAGEDRIGQSKDAFVMIAAESLIKKGSEAEHKVGQQ